MSNSLDPDQARRFVGPDLGLNCLPRLSADDTGSQRIKHITGTSQYRSSSKFATYIQENWTKSWASIKTIMFI